MNKIKTDAAIQVVAANLFQKYGFEKTSMEDIAREAHKSKRSIYNYFSNKEELFMTLVSSEIDNIRHDLESLTEDESQHFLPRFRQYLLQRVQLFASAVNLRVAIRDRMFRENNLRFRKLNQSKLQFIQWERQFFKKVWESIKTDESPEIVDKQASAFADMLQVTLNGLSYTFFVEDKYDQYKTSYRMLIDLIINSISLVLSTSKYPFSEFSLLQASN
ncbi:MAG: TetR/AcrR family transcriptional regulator [Bacteroidales bacterium]|nr:TetR/AcrR family transcriptional regulator [Bacteroidales bacterium]MBO7646567.1 TetR/AcrR family transcriptional regulator [Bacteroidales bacterium]